MRLKYTGNITYADFLVISENEKTVLAEQLMGLNSEINADLLFIASVEKSGINAQTSVALSQGQVIENFSYSLDGSPCEEVLSNETCSIPKNVAQLYPKDIALVEMNIEAYIGVPILNDENKPIGILVGLYFSSKPDIHKLKIRFSAFASYFSALLQKSFLEKKAQLHLTLFDEIEELSNVGAWEYQIATNELFWSKQVYRIHGISTEAKVSIDDFSEHYQGPDGQRLNHLFEQAINEGVGYCEEVRFIDADNNRKWIRANAKVEKNQQNQVIRVFGTFEDISAEKSLLTSEQEKTNRLNSIINNLNDALVITDQDGIIVQVNPMAKHIFESGNEDMLGLPIVDLLTENNALEYASYLENYKESGTLNVGSMSKQMAAHRKNGDVLQIELSITQAFDNGKLQLINVIRDISERILAEDTIYNLAYTDSITGLKNKRWFEKEYGDLFKSASKQKAYVYAAIIDIDKLSQFNLQYGMKAGNEALKQIGQKLAKASTKSFQIYKKGVDSFLILSSHSAQDITAVAPLQSVIDATLLERDNFVVDIKGNQIAISASLGSAILNVTQHNLETFFDTLEFAIDSAKLMAPFGSYFADSEALKQYDRSKVIQSSLSHVSSEQGFRVALQPQYDANGGFDCSEALLRWQHLELGNISPVEFIRIAEQSDAIIKLGNWVLEEVCEILHGLQSRGVKTCIAVNISVKQIVFSDFAASLMAITKKWQVSPQQLVLELTETTLVSDMELVKSVMIDLNQKGFRFSIDDFGTGYSSLSYLKDLPIAELKIDKSFVDTIADTQHSSGHSIVDMIIGMANALDVRSVAEGVEYPEQFEYLKTKGCDVFQGYLFSKPLEVAQWTKLFDND